MNKQTLLSLIVAGALVGGAQAAGPDLDLSQPPDPQPAGGPTGDGEDWEGDGRAPLTDDADDSGSSPSDKGAGGSNDIGMKQGKSAAGQARGRASSDKRQ